MESFIKYLLLPSGMILTLVVLGFILSFMRKARKIGLYLILSAGILYVFFGIGPISFWLLGNLEYKYPFVDSIKVANEGQPIVVLAGHAENDPNKPISGNVNSSTAFRLIEAVRLLQKNPESELIQLRAVVWRAAVGEESAGSRPPRFQLNSTSRPS